jgi:single-strand DNA-binding protein
MGSLNKVMLIGNLGRDPEVRSTASGVKVSNFSIATTESFTDRNGQKQDRTEWHNIVMWRGLAELAEKYLRKGAQIYVEGKLQTRSWDDQNGNKRQTTEVVVDNLVMLGRREGGRDGGDDGGRSFNRSNESRGGGGEYGGSSYSNDREPSERAPSDRAYAGSAGGPPAPEDDLPF